MSKYGVAFLATLVQAPAAPQVLSGGTLMTLHNRSVRWLAVLLAVPCLPFSVKAAPATTKPASAKPATKTAPQKPEAPLQGDRKILHVLNRLGFGPRPGEVEAVRALSVERWIENQLQPESIDDSAVERQLARFAFLQMPAPRLQLAYEVDTANFLKKLMQARYPDMNATAAMEMGGQRPGQMRKAARDETLQLSPAELAALTSQQRLTLQALQNGDMPLGASHQALGELANAKVLRAASSKRQLQEVLVDFWSNHFNLDVKKGPVRTLKIADERDVIRPHVWGRFRDLLGASAKSPAMLFYLDNVRSTREMAPPRRNANARASKRRGGINENYARELMELHTLGVDGGYTQRDVQEVARCLTGWSIDRDSGTFRFRLFMHDNGEKLVLGQKIAAGGGMEDGEKVLDILAAHPSTAKFIARKLCMRLVADEPSPVLIERTAKVFRETQGDLRAVTRSIITSPEFFSASAFRAKIKSPFEFAVSAVRALDGSLTLPDARRPFGRQRLVADGRASQNANGNRQRKSLVQSIAQLGQPLFSYQAPTGWSEDSREWVSTGALIARLNFALTLAGGEVAQVDVAPGQMLHDVAADDHNAVLNRLSNVLLGGEMSPSTRATLLKQMPAGTPADANKLTALVLGSPEFQRR
jgi:uncharacterized protein (DUF1800 family)